MVEMRSIFDESWYKVKDLKPHIRAGVEIDKQYYKRIKWYVVSDMTNSANNLRINESSYYFISLINGKITVNQAWEETVNVFQEYAPKQGEIIRLLGQFYLNNLLRVEMSDDAKGMLERYKKRKKKQVVSTLSNILFLKIPLFDPDKILNNLSRYLFPIFTIYGFFFWLIIVSWGLSQIIMNWDELYDKSSNILDPDNLILLYLSFVLLKVIHEIAHGVACKEYGRREGVASEIHTIGIMLLLLTPVPFVDTSCVWQIRNKYSRIVVSAAGMYIEFAVAALAAVVWANTGAGTILHAVCYNIMFTASASTLLFNINPLLRFDGYYMLTDYLETPNLQIKSREYVINCVKKRLFKVTRISYYNYRFRERCWLFVYGIASITYKIIISFSITFFVLEKLFVVGIVFLLGLIVSTVIKPVLKLLSYLFFSYELQKKRLRAMGLVLGLTLLLFYGLGIIRVSDKFVAEGVVEAQESIIVSPDASGYLVDWLSTDKIVHKSDILFRLSNYDLLSEKEQAEYQIKELNIRRMQAIKEMDYVAADMYLEKIESESERFNLLQKDCHALAFAAPFAGKWISPRLNIKEGSFINKGEVLGYLKNENEKVLYAAVDQNEAARLFSETDFHISYRVIGKDNLYGEDELTGTVLPSGKRHLHSAALSYFGGGEHQVDNTDREGTHTKSNFFEIKIIVDSTKELAFVDLGKRVYIRFDFAPKSLFEQIWRKISQILQKRLNR